MSRKEVRLLIGIPSTMTWMADFGMSLAMLMAYSSQHAPFAKMKVWGLQVVNTKGSILPRNRELEVEEAQKLGCTHLLFLDSDMVFPRDTAHMLLQHNLPVVAANCVTKVIPAKPTARKKSNDPWGEKVYTDPKSKGLEEVWRIGCAVMLIDMKVFDTLTPPYFSTRYEPAFKEYLGEDWAFCERLEKERIPIYIDHDLSKHVKHVGQFQYHHMHVGEVVEEKVLPMQNKVKCA